jgi:integrase
MATFRLHDNNTIYLYHWIDSKTPFKVSTKIKISSDAWDKQNQKPYSNRATYNGTVISTALTQILADFNACIANMTAKGIALNVYNIKSHFNNQSSSDSFITFYEAYLKENSRNFKQYNAPLEHIKNFHRGSLSFNTVDYLFFQRFYSYLESEGLNNNTISYYFKVINRVFKKAVAVGVIDKAPALPNLRIVDKDAIALTNDELKAIYSYAPKTPQAIIVRDYFILGAYTGLRFSDWHKAKLPATGNMMNVTTTKTVSTALIPIHPIVREILTKYNNQMPEKTDNCNMNRTLRRIAKAAGIKGSVDVVIIKGGKKVVQSKDRCNMISTHSARRSCCTLLILDKVPVQVVMAISGHQTYKSFSKYIKIDKLNMLEQLNDIAFFK